MKVYRKTLALTKDGLTNAAALAETRVRLDALIAKHRLPNERRIETLLRAMTNMDDAAHAGAHMPGGVTRQNGAR